MQYKGKVIEILEGPTPLNYGFNIKVKAELIVKSEIVKSEIDEGQPRKVKTFSYVFVKNHKSDVDLIVAGYEFEMNCKPIAF